MDSSQNTKVTNRDSVVLTLSLIIFSNNYPPVNFSVQEKRKIKWYQEAKKINLKFA